MKALLAERKREKGERRLQKHSLSATMREQPPRPTLAFNLGSLSLASQDTIYDILS
jgi:hypothetical protein